MRSRSRCAISSISARALVALFLMAALLFDLMPTQAKTIDLRIRSESPDLYDVAFCARPSPNVTSEPGHAFVAFSHQYPNGMRDFLAIGHTVSAGTSHLAAAWSYFGRPVSGLLKPEFYTSIRQNCLDVEVNRDDYVMARAMADDPLHKLGLVATEGVVLESYKLGSDDCMAFIISVADLLKSRGLKVPARKFDELPMSYIARFIAAN